MKASLLAGAAALLATAAHAQPTPEMTAKALEVGRVVDPPSSVALFAGVHAPASAGVVRDLAYGAHPREVLDVFPATGGAPRPVLIFLPGGQGDKRSTVPGGEGLFDNVMLWARTNGMVGVNAQRRNGPEPDAPVEDVAMTIRWVVANIGRYGGDPSRIFVWGHSAGATSLAQYLARPDLQGPAGAGVKGAILGAGTYNLLPFQPKSPPAQTRIGLRGQPQDSPIPSDPARSIAAGIRASRTPLFIEAAEYDPPVLIEMAEALDRELRAAGRTPTFAVFKGHGHLTSIFAVNTQDQSTSAPMLAWMRSIR